MSSSFHISDGESGRFASERICFANSKNVKCFVTKPPRRETGFGWPSDRVILRISAQRNRRIAVNMPEGSYLARRDDKGTRSHDPRPPDCLARPERYSDVTSVGRRARNRLHRRGRLCASASPASPASNALRRVAANEGVRFEMPTSVSVCTAAPCDRTIGAPRPGIAGGALRFLHLFEELPALR